MNIFLTSQANKVLAKIALLLPKQPSEYKVLFIPTAANLYEEKPWMDDDRIELIQLGFKVTDLDIALSTVDEVKQAAEDTDVIFVAGGNTFYLLEHIKKTKFDQLVKEVVSSGKIYIGSSAGSAVAAPDIRYVERFDDPKEASLTDTKGIGLVNFAVLPHAGKEKYEEIQKEVLEEYKDWHIVPISDEQFIIPKSDAWEIIGANL